MTHALAWDEIESLARNWSSRTNRPYDVTQTKAVDRRLAFRYLTTSSTVLDVGGGSATDSGLLAMVGANVTLLEIEERYLQRGKDLVREFGLDDHFAFVMASATALPFRKQMFDIVTCFSVLDHLPDKLSVQRAVQEFAKVVRGEGHVAITFPNKSFLVATMSSKLRMALNKSGRDKAYWEQRFTVKEFTRYVARSGMRVRVYDYGTPQYVGEGIMVHNLPFQVRIVRAALLRASFSVFLISMNFLLRQRGMYLFGPRFGVLCETVQSEPQG